MQKSEKSRKKVIAWSNECNIYAQKFFFSMLFCHCKVLQSIDTLFLKSLTDLKQNLT